MEFPFGHHHHSHTHHHHQRQDDDEERSGNYYPPPATDPPPPPPPPYNTGDEFAHPPPQRSHFYQESHYPPPPPQRFHPYQDSDYPPPPPPQSKPFYQEPQHTYHQEPHYPHQESSYVTHVSHDLPQETETHHSFKPHMPSFIHHHTHESAAAGSGLDLSNKPTVKVYCKAQPNFHLTIRGGKVILARADPSDEHQKWYKDEKYSTRVKDDEGYPCFALVNKATGEAMKHSVGATHPVQLIPYNPNVLDEAILWTLSKDFGDGFRTIRMVNNTSLNVDAFHGDKHSGGVHDGTTIVLWKWNKGENQLWKIVPQCKFLN